MAEAAAAAAAAAAQHHQQQEESDFSGQKQHRFRRKTTTAASPSGGGSTTSSVPSSCTPSVASLIQSAAKVSMLDQEITPESHQRYHDSTSSLANEEQPPHQATTTRRTHGASTSRARNHPSHQQRLFDDDEYDNLDIEHTHSLQSLQKELLPPMPDEQDRKRFLGCLAAVLASLYEYDVVHIDDEENDDDDNEHDVDGGRDDVHQQANCLTEIQHSISNSFYGEDDSVDENEQEEEVVDFFDDHSEKDPRRAIPRAVSADSVSPASYPCARTNGPTHRNLNTRKQHSDLEELTGSPTSRQQRHMLSEKYASSTPSRHSHRDQAAKALLRHRRRRYEVFSKLMASSAELLQLDKSQGKCFVPMLSGLQFARAASKQQPHQPQQGSQRYASTRRQTIAFRNEHDFWQHVVGDIPHLPSFLQDMTVGAGIRCLALFLSQHLLQGSRTGYDARIRHAIRKLGVLLLLHDLLRQTYFDSSMGEDEDAPNESKCEDLITLATRKFESLEHFIALKLLQLSRAQQELEEQSRNHTHGNKKQPRSRRGHRKSHTGKFATTGGASSSITMSTRDQIIRGLKIGGTAVAAGTLFAITGGLAAPGIAAGVAAIAGTTAVASAAAMLTTTAAVTTIFGVGGGSLVAYKMQRRTKGLTEFEFCKESGKHKKPEENDHQDKMPDAELFTTICISGWLRDDCDFQRPWGISPDRPPIPNRQELLERFYSVHKPSHIPKCRKILASWKNEEWELWQLLRKNYGRDPANLFPLDDGPRMRGSLTLEEQEVIDRLFLELGCTVRPAKGGEMTQAEKKRQQSPLERMRKNSKVHYTTAEQPMSSSLVDSMHGPHPPSDDSLLLLVDDDGATSRDGDDNAELDMSKLKHLSTVWDYQATYGGEVYTVRWESHLLEELCNSVLDLAADVVTGATTTLLKFTALSALAAAVAVPAALTSAANMIDGSWTLAAERSEEAGRELAQSLLFSSAGNRPVTLVGFSFGSRVIYSCLKELARHQEKWEEYQERKRNSGEKGKRQSRDKSRKETDSFFDKMREPASIVGDAILMGLPNHLSLSSWKASRQVVAGRLVNCYSQKDLILSLMFQIKKFGLKPVCGTCPVNVAGVENFDVTDLVSGHQDYCLITGEILKRVRQGQPFGCTLLAGEQRPDEDGNAL